MANKPIKTPVAAALGAAFITSLAGAGIAQAETDANPFALNPLSSGYQVAEAEGKCGEGKCGGTAQSQPKESESEGKCGEGKCGGTAQSQPKESESEGKCGEGKCGAQ